MDFNAVLWILDLDATTSHAVPRTSGRVPFWCWYWWLLVAGRTLKGSFKGSFTF